MRVAQVLNRMDSGGIEAVVMNYYRHVDRSRVQFDFYFAADSAFPQKEELERLGARVYLVPAYSRPFAYHKALYEAFKKRKYRVVHAHLSTMSVFALFAAWHARVPVRICHNHTTAHWGEGKKTLLKYALRPFNKWFATTYFACSRFAGEWMFGKRAMQKGKVVVMPNAIDLARFAFDQDARQAIRDELAIPRDALVVGHVGRFMYQKNHAFTVQIFEALRKEDPRARLLLVGEGELESAIREQVKRSGLEKAVCFAGVRDDVARVYSAMDVFLLPSFYEGFGVAALEAQANGMACVLSDQVPTEVDVTGKDRFLPLSRPAGEWAKAVLAAADQRDTSGSCIQGMTQFSIDEKAKELTDFYLHCNGDAVLNGDE